MADRGQDLASTQTGDVWDGGLASPSLSHSVSFTSDFKVINSKPDLLLTDQKWQAKPWGTIFIKPAHISNNIIYHKFRFSHSSFRTEDFVMAEASEALDLSTRDP